MHACRHAWPMHTCLALGPCVLQAEPSSSSRPVAANPERDERDEREKKKELKRLWFLVGNDVCHPCMLIHCHACCQWASFHVPFPGHRFPRRRKYVPLLLPQHGLRQRCRSPSRPSQSQSRPSQSHPSPHQNQQLGANVDEVLQNLTLCPRTLMQKFWRIRFVRSMRK